MGLKPDLQGGTGFNLLRVQFWTPVQRKRVSKGVRKWTPLKSKVVPPGGSSFGPFIVANLLKRRDLPTRCWFEAHWNSAAEEGAWMSLKPDLQGGTGFNLLRVQFWTPVQRKRVSKGVRKWTPLKSKVVPPGGSSFGPFIVANLLKRLFQVEADLTSNSCEWKLELGRPIFARLLFLTF